MSLKNSVPTSFDYVSFTSPLDSRSGTGLLAMIAQRALIQRESDALRWKCEGRGGQVTSCEGFPPMARLAARMLTRNGMSADVALVNKRSNDMEVGKDLPRKANLLVCISDTSSKAPVFFSRKP